MATLSLSPSRALHRPRHLDRRVLAGLFIVAATLSGSLAAWNGATAGHGVLEVTRALPAGAILAPTDLIAVSVRVDDDVLAGLVPAAGRAATVGRAVSEAIPAHSLLTRAGLAIQPPLGPDEMELTIPVTPQTALDGQIRVGDTVAVLWTQGKGTPQSKTNVLIDRAIVRGVGYDPGTASINAGGADATAGHGSVNAVTLVLTSAQAVAVAQAKWNGDLDVARVAANGSVVQGSTGDGSQTAGAAR